MPLLNEQTAGIIDDESDNGSNAYDIVGIPLYANPWFNSALKIDKIKKTARVNDFSI